MLLIYNKYMNDVKITVIRVVNHYDLMEKYENKIEHACDLKEGMTFICKNATCPENLCFSAWGVMKEFVEALALDKEEIYEGWMQNKDSYMISCNDGFRPVSFLLEKIK